MNGAQLPKQETLIFGGFIYDKGKIIPMVTSGSETINIDLSKGFVPRAINDDNIIVGRATTLNGCPTAFVWRNSKMINLNTLIPGNIGWSLIDARDINSLGQIVGTAKYNRQSHAFLLTPNQQKTK